MNQNILTQVVANNPKDALEAANRLRSDGYQIAAYQAYLTTLDEITKRLINYKLENIQSGETTQERKRPKNLELSTLFEVAMICLKRAQSTAYLVNPNLIPSATSHNVPTRPRQNFNSSLLQPPTIPAKSSNRLGSNISTHQSKEEKKKLENRLQRTEVNQQPMKQNVPIFMSRSTPNPSLENDANYGTSRFSRFSELTSTDFRKKLESNIKSTFTRREVKPNKERSLSLVSSLRSKFEPVASNSSTPSQDATKKEGKPKEQQPVSNKTAVPREPARKPSLRSRLSDQLLSLKIDSGSFNFSNPNPLMTVESPVQIKHSENLTLAIVNEGGSDTSTIEELPAETSISNSTSLIDVRPEFCIDANDLVQVNFQPFAQIPTDDFKCVQIERIPYIPRSPLLTVLERTTEKLESAKAELVKLAKSKVNSVEKDIQFEALKVVVTNCNSTMERVSRLTRVDNLNYNFHSFPPALFAYQLTLIESNLFRAISPTALLQHTSRTPHPKVAASTDFFNYLTRIIEMSVLICDSVEERVFSIKFWIKVGCHLQKLRNFQTLMAVNSALMSTPLRRLSATWSEVSKKDTSRLLAIRNFMSEADNYSCYRQHLDALGVSASGSTTDYMSPAPSPTIRKPIIPYLGLFIMDITYLLAAAKKPSSRKSSSASEISTTASKELGSNGTSEHNRVSEDSRLVDLIQKFRNCINGPDYDVVPPHRYLKQPSHMRTPTLGSLGSLTFSFNKTTSITSTTNSAPISKDQSHYLSLPNFSSHSKSESAIKFSTTVANSETSYPSNKATTRSPSHTITPQRSRYLKADSSLTQHQMSITHHLLSQVYVTERYVDHKSLEVQPKDDDSGVLLDESSPEQQELPTNLANPTNLSIKPPKIDQNIESFYLFGPASPPFNILR